MTGMESVLAAHTLDVVIPDSWDETKTWTVFCDCGWVKPVPEHRPGEIAHAAHVAEALQAAGFGNLHDAWAEGHDAGWDDRDTDPEFTPNPYPKVSES